MKFNTHEAEYEADDLSAAVQRSRKDVACYRMIMRQANGQVNENHALVLREPPRVPGPDPPLREDTDDHGRTADGDVSTGIKYSKVHTTYLTEVLMPTDRKAEYCMMIDVFKLLKPALGQNLCCRRRIMKQGGRR